MTNGCKNYFPKWKTYGGCVHDTSQGFVQAKYPNKVFNIQKSIYGLKQASQSWNHYSDEKIKEFGFVIVKMKLVCVSKLVGKL